MSNFVLENLNFQSQCFFKTLTLTKLHTWIHFDRKHIIFKKLWYYNLKNAKSVMDASIWVKFFSKNSKRLEINHSLLKRQVSSFWSGAQMHSYGESILTCVFLYKMKKRCKQITLMNVTKRDVTGPPVTHIRSYS